MKEIIGILQLVHQTVISYEWNGTEIILPKLSYIQDLTGVWL